MVFHRAFEKQLLEVLCQGDEMQLKWPLPRGVLIYVGVRLSHLSKSRYTKRAAGSPEDEPPPNPPSLQRVHLA